MTIQPSPYEVIRAIQDQQRATDRLVQILVGMLDKSQPEPLLSFQPPAAHPAQREPAKKLRRVTGPAGRPPAAYTLDGISFTTTERRVEVLDALRESPQGLSDLVRLGFAPRTNAMMAQIIDINRELAKAGSHYQIKAQPRPTRTTGRGSLAPKYELSKVSETAGSAAQLSGNAAEPSPVVEPVENDYVDGGASAQSHSAEGRPAIPSKPGDARTGQGPQAETRNAIVPPGENAGSAVRDGAHNPDAAAAPLSVPVARPPEVAIPPAEPTAAAVLQPERLAAVDVPRCRVFGPGGDIFVNARAARALDVLKHGDLFGLDHVAARAKIPSASDCRHALRIEETALRSIGLEVWSDKFNARLREAS